MKTTILTLLCVASVARSSKPTTDETPVVKSEVLHNVATTQEYKELIRTDYTNSSRRTRDLRIPFSVNRRPAETQVPPKPPSAPQASPRVFSHPKIRPELSQPNQRHYHPAYSQGTLHRPNNQSPRHPSRNQNERQQVRSSPLQRAPNHAVSRQPSRQNEYMQDRRPFPSYPSRQPSSPFSPIEDEIINSESQGHHTRSRIVDVYHHVPVRPNQDSYPGFSDPKPPIEIQSLQSYFKPDSHFVSPRPTVIPQVFVSTRSTPAVFASPQTTNVPHVFVSFRPTSKPRQTFPPPSSTNRPRNSEFHVYDDMPEPPSMFTRKPIDLPPRLPRPPSADRKPSFEFKPNIPMHPKDEPSIRNLHPRPPSNKQMPSPPSESGDSHGLFSTSTEKPEELTDGNVRIIQATDKSPTNSSVAVKKYWDFRQENGGLSVPLNAAPSIRQVVQSKPIVGVVNDFHHGLGSVSSPPASDNPTEVKNTNTFNDESQLIKPQSVSGADKSVDKSHIAKVSPHSVQIETLRETLPKIPLLNNSTSLENVPSSTTDADLNSSLPNLAPGPVVIHAFKNEGDSKRDSANSPGQSHKNDTLALLDKELKYIPADIFRRNLTVSAGNVFNLHKYFSESPEDVGSPVVSENTARIPVRPSSGLYVRNRAQFEKFDESSSYEPSEDSDSEPKQYFRGPQHFADEWTILEDHPVSYGGSRRLISTSIPPNFNSLLIIPTTAMPRKFTTPAQSTTHRKVINALHHASKVFGRRNITRTFTVSTTEKPEAKRFRFTYSPLPKPSTAEAKDDSKQFFDFKSGTTHIVPQGSSSPETKIEAPGTHNDSRITVNGPLYDSEKKFNAGTRPGHRLDLLNHRRNNGTAGDKRLYYINLKPVTRSYVSSISHSSTTSAVPRTKLKTSVSTESSTFAGINQPTTPLSVNTESNTEQPHRHVLPVFHANITPPHRNSEANPAPKVETFTRVPIVEVVGSSTTLGTPRSIIRGYYTTPRSSVQRVYTTPRLIIERIPTSATTQNTETSPTQTTLRTTTTTTTPRSTTTQRTTTTTRLNTPTQRTTTPSTTTRRSNIRIAGAPRIPGFVKSRPTPAKPEVVTAGVSQEEAAVESLKSVKAKMQETMSKGMRHLMPMVMELSSEVSVSGDCTFSLLRWLRGIRTFEPWAVKMMDASSKIPEGILFGTMSTFGSYDECIAVKTPKRGSQLSYTGKYCSINIQPILPENEHHFTIQNAFRRYPKLKKTLKEMNIEEETMAYYYILKHRIGLCVPSTCSVEDIQNVTEKLADQLMMKISVSSCETSERSTLTRGQIISMAGVFIAFGIVLLGTVFDLMLRHRLDHDMDIEEIVRKKSSLRQFSYAFSAYRNTCKILSTSIPMNHISAIHGIKFLSITWIMLGHVYYCKDYLTLAGLNRVRDLGANLAFQVILNSGYAADTFFFLSGLLVVYSTLQYLENTDGYFTIVGFYIKRYCRLTPAFLMISGVILLGPLAGSGPIWNETLEPFVTGCQNYWWTNLFYFSNFIPTDKTCVPHGWFLACDMQFYLISPVIILALYRRPKMGLTLISLGIISSMSAAGFLTFIYNLPPVSLFSLPSPSDINEYLDTMGYKPYAHYSAYCVGMATGFILAAKQKIVISRCLQIFGWAFSITSCMLVVYGTWKWNGGNLPDWTISVAYATTSRTVWSMGIAWLTIACYAGYGGIINDILCWHGFVPLSRLTLLAYLIHPLLMYIYASYIRTPFYFSQYVMIYLYFGHLCVTFGLAFLFSLAFEMPFLNLEKIISRKLDESRRKRRASFSHHHSNWQHPEYPEIKDSVVLMRRRTDRFLT